MTDYTPETTPVELHGGHLVKREDLYQVAGVYGGKTRTCWALSKDTTTGLVTAGSRNSPQANTVAQIAKRLGVPCRVHVPSGRLSAELLDAQQAGAEVVQHQGGYNSVITSRARADAAARGWTLIPFGMECQAAIDETAAQVRGLPWWRIKRIVIAVGSGMSLAGLLWGLERARQSVPVLGVVVGADPTARLNRWAPAFWEVMTRLQWAPMNYHHKPRNTRLGDLRLDPYYEAKAVPFLEPGDLFWVVGIRRTEVPVALLRAGEAA